MNYLKSLSLKFSGCLFIACLLCIRGVYDNFEKRNISLIEFLDMYASYKTHMLQMNELQLQRLNALEKLNFLIGTEVF